MSFDISLKRNSLREREREREGVQKYVILLFHEFKLERSTPDWTAIRARREKARSLPGATSNHDESFDCDPRPPCLANSCRFPGRATSDCLSIRRDAIGRRMEFGRKRGEKCPRRSLIYGDREIEPSPSSRPSSRRLSFYPPTGEEKKRNGKYAACPPIFRVSKSIFLPLRVPCTARSARL